MFKFQPFTGEYNNHHDTGTYTCVGCGAELFRYFFNKIINLKQMLLTGSTCNIMFINSHSFFLSDITKNVLLVMFIKINTVPVPPFVLNIIIYTCYSLRYKVD